ncbi:hypothetical protein KVT40_005781 [Elsinoe batatas]|uniref:Trafficking protein particle complex subunit 12 n=1 Tax=Elsinoe batatas TaxID=2601811 RepID=A0A8K0PEK0_9PEZI|nr:hypothetical protein KVT40_005781 [Elsinoe batatas]
MSSHSDLPTRTRSARQSAVRRSTRGPLDDEDPLAPTPTTSSPPSPTLSNPPTSTLSPTSLLSPPLSALTGSSQRLPPLSLSQPLSTRPVSPSPKLDLTFLLRPQLYSPLPSTSLLPPFLGPTHQQPPKDATLSNLVDRSFYRHAAIKAASDLCTGVVPSSDAKAVLDAFHVRLACLLVCGYLEVAAGEARPLGEYLSRLTAGSGRGGPGGGSRPGSSAGQVGTGVGFVPWGLRVLVQRLAGIGAQDGGRRAVMGWFLLAGECRARFAGAGTEEEREVWRARLGDLGVRVAGELVGMGEVDAAVRHLEELEVGDGEEGDEMRARLGLLYVRIGDVRRAEGLLGSIQGWKGKQVLGGLIRFAEGDYEGAAALFKELHAKDDEDALVANNYAIALLYTGHMEEAAEVLEKLVDETTPSSATLFNLATMYELATEKAVERKAKLVDRVASRGPENGGWERAGADFKL